MSDHQSSTFDMTGKTIVITGATSGIGAAAAHALADQGARLILLARDPERGAAAIASLRTGPAQQHCLYLADLTSMADVKRAAAEIVRAEPAIDTLINNAGSWFNQRRLTSEGLERTFALNHMAYFNLTLGLADRLANTQGARVINTASFVHKVKYDGANLQSENNFSTNAAYARSKLCNILFTRALARRWQSLDVTVNCFSPGFVQTNFGAGEGGVLEPIYRLTKRWFGKSPAQGAATLIFLATSEDVAGVTGEYFERCEISRPSDDALNDANADDLWKRSSTLAKLTGEGSLA